ncbi:MAG: DUF2804 family protein [Deltaproteobacteria bacterium]|nr:DUF2804 family protein [Deltaproteobacteria bacterium]
MTGQLRITEPLDLLQPDGTLTRAGWATRPFWRYGRAAIRAGWHRIKEWDYYAVLSQEGGIGLTLTVADLGYLGLGLGPPRGAPHRLEPRLRLQRSRPGQREPAPLRGAGAQAGRGGLRLRS